MEIFVIMILGGFYRQAPPGCAPQSNRVMLAAVSGESAAYAESAGRLPSVIFGAESEKDLYSFG